MKSIVNMVMAILLIQYSVFQASVAFAQSENVYRLSTGDVISLTVFNEPELGLQDVKIPDDGNISVPLLGQVQVKGKSVLEVETLLTKLFGDDYLRNPSVSVAVSEYRPFYINGEVDDPGSYPFRTNMTVQMAITIAGGFTERASKREIYLLPEGKESQKRKVTLGDQVQPGDVLTIGESFF